MDAEKLHVEAREGGLRHRKNEHMNKSEFYERNKHLVLEKMITFTV